MPVIARGAVVEVRDLTWRPFGRREPVLAGINLRIEAGSRVLLAGPSGSGKSTLLRALAGVLTTTETGDLAGSVLIDGSPSSGSSVGLMVQDPPDALVAGRVGRDVAFGPENLGMPRDQIWSRVRVALASAGFPYDEDHSTSELSGGETQRLALAGVLALTPSLVLLDEPTSMLDPASAAMVREAITSALGASGATLVMVQHQLSDWVDEVDRLVVLDPAGRVSVDGPAAGVGGLACRPGSLGARRLGPATTAGVERAVQPDAAQPDAVGWFWAGSCLGRVGFGHPPAPSVSHVRASTGRAGAGVARGLRRGSRRGVRCRGWPQRCRQVDLDRIAGRCRRAHPWSRELLFAAPRPAPGHAPMDLAFLGRSVWLGASAGGPGRGRTHSPRRRVVDQPATGPQRRGCAGSS